MLNGSFSNYYQPTTQQFSGMYNMSSQMYSNPFISQAMQPLPVFQPQTSYSSQGFGGYSSFGLSQLMPQTSYSSQGFGGYSNFGYSQFQPQMSFMGTQFSQMGCYTPQPTIQYGQQNSSMTLMLLSVLQNLIGFLPGITQNQTQPCFPQQPQIPFNNRRSNPIAEIFSRLAGIECKDDEQDSSILDIIDQLAGINTRDDGQDTSIADILARLTGINTRDDGQDTSIADILAKLVGINSTVNGQSTSIADILAKLANLQSKVDTPITPKFLKNNLSAAELNWYINNNIDLTEVDAAGAPKYLIAKGQNDGKYHIYKQYSGTTYKSVTAVASGNNYLYTTDAASNKNMANIARSVGGDFIINQGKYTTGSPLVLDLNGNGKVDVKQGVGVDIDGNGAADGAAADGDKMLALGDLNGNGKIDGSEVFGNETIDPFTGQKINAANGFEALREIAKSAEAKTGTTIIENGKVDLIKLKEALKTVGSDLGLIGGDNVTTLESLGNVTKINLTYEDKNDDYEYMTSNLNKDSISLQIGSFETTDGTSHKVDDVWFKLA